MCRLARYEAHTAGVGKGMRLTPRVLAIKGTSMRPQ